MFKQHVHTSFKVCKAFMCKCVCVCVRVVVVRTFDVRDVFGPEMYGNVSFEVPLAMLAEEHMVCYMP